jgi:hypothetical protein
VLYPAPPTTTAAALYKIDRGPISEPAFGRTCGRTNRGDQADGVARIEREQVRDHRAVPLELLSISGGTDHNAGLVAIQTELCACAIARQLLISRPHQPRGRNMPRSHLTWVQNQIVIGSNESFQSSRVRILRVEIASHKYFRAGKRFERLNQLAAQSSWECVDDETTCAGRLDVPGHLLARRLNDECGIKRHDVELTTSDEIHVGRVTQDANTTMRGRGASQRHSARKMTPAAAQRVHQPQR